MDIVIICGLPKIHMQNLPYASVPSVNMNRFVASNDEVGGPPVAAKARLRLVP